MGEVRKFVQEMRENQSLMKLSSRARIRKDSLIEMKINGYATGSYFYPHDQISTGGVVLGNLGNVSTIESPSKRKNYSKEKRNRNRLIDSPIKVLMPEITSVQLKASNEFYNKSGIEDNDRDDPLTTTIQSIGS